MLNFTENQMVGSKIILENEGIFEIFKKENGIKFIIEFLRNSPLEFVEANKVFLKIFQNIIDREINSNSPLNLNSNNLKISSKEKNIKNKSEEPKLEDNGKENENKNEKEKENINDNNIMEYFNIIIFCLGKFEKNNGIIIYLIDIIKTIITITNENNHKKIGASFFSDLLDIIFKILYNTNSSKIAANGFNIFDMILKNSDFDYYQLIRNKNPLNLVVRILNNFRNDNIVSFHACGFLSKVLEKEDINNFLKIMEIKNIKNLKIGEIKDIEIESFLPEIKEILLSDDNENKLNSLKKNIIRILILMSKDKNFLQLLKDINCLDIFVKLLKSDLEIIEMKNKNLKEITFDKENNNINSNNNIDINKGIKHESKYERLEKKFKKKSKNLN
jgi:hypothetical protein